MNRQLQFALLTVLGVAQARAAVEQVFHNFTIFSQGANPYGKLARDTSGNLYGTAYKGGTANLGVVFKLSKQGYQVLHNFTGGNDGANPYAGVTLDSAGNLYGTTYLGGSKNSGVVYKIDTTGQETVLYTFTSGADGRNPYAGVTLDSAGNLYGTTVYSDDAGYGVVYKLDPAGHQTVLYTFTRGAGGTYPYSGVTLDSAGNLYGTTYQGGYPGGNCTAVGCGVVYKLDPSGKETVLHTFLGRNTSDRWPFGGVVLDTAGNLYGTTGNGVPGVIYKIDTVLNYTVLFEFVKGQTPASPEGDLVIDAGGNLYGTAQYSIREAGGSVFELDTTGNLQELYSFPGGGYDSPTGPNPGLVADPFGNLYGVTAYAGAGGIIFKVDPSGQETTLYSLAGAPGGTVPDVFLNAPVIRDAAGNLYGTTWAGGTANAGLVYQLSPAGQETVLYTFSGGADGYEPLNIIRDSAGNIYGITNRGGSAKNVQGWGVVYKLDTSGRQTVLHTFTGGADGGLPTGIIRDPAGNFYGTTAGGGSAGHGVVFKLDPSGQETVLHSFTGGEDGAGPLHGVVLDSAGNLYGTTYYGGFGGGVVYKIDPQGQETVLHIFRGEADGEFPMGVILDSEGNLYGVTTAGSGTSGQYAYGLIFELTVAGQYQVLYAFTGGADGGEPAMGLVRDSAGNLYGATKLFGNEACNSGAGCGTVFQLNPSGQLTVLYTFTGGADGSGSGALTLGSDGVLYGPAAGGAFQGGLIYRLSPN